MMPIIIIPEDKKEITLKIEDFKKYITEAYHGGYNDGYEKGIIELNDKPSITNYRDVGGVSLT